MKLVTALLVKNEGAPDRYLARVLTRCAEFSDHVLVLDDNSTDQTAQIAAECPKTLVKRRQAHDPAWGAESSARAELWTRGAKLAGDGWLLICDADMLLQGDPRPLCASWDCNAWAIPLWDCWDDEQHARVDGPWAGGPSVPRPWLFRPSAGGAGTLAFGPPDAIGRKHWEPRWQDRGIHVGHCPHNFELICGIAPPDVYWLHMAYVKPEHRRTKHAQYLAVASQLSEFELAHAASIIE